MVCKTTQAGATLARDFIFEMELETWCAEFVKSKPRYLGCHESVIRADGDVQTFRAG